MINYGREFGCVRIKSRVCSTSDLTIRIKMTAHNLSTVKLQIHIYYFNSNNVNILLFHVIKRWTSRTYLRTSAAVTVFWRHAKTISQSRVINPRYIFYWINNVWIDLLYVHMRKTAGHVRIYIWVHTVNNAK